MLPDDPILPGATWRPLTPDDAGPLAVAIEAARAADRGEEVFTQDDLLRELSDPRAPTATNTLALALPDGSLAGWAIVNERFHARLARRVFLDGSTNPAVRGRGIGTRLLRWAIARGAETLAAQPADLPRFLEAFRDVTTASAVELHLDHGFTAVRHYMDMRRVLAEALPAEPAVPGVRIAPYDAALAEAVRVAHNEAFADHWSSEPIRPEDWERDFVGDPHFRADLSFVALAGDEVAGYSANYCSEADWVASDVRDAWIGQLGVRRPWRGRGLATALLIRSMASFRAAEMDAASLGVDTENPTGAVGLYERLGFGVNRRFVRLRRPLVD
jgi:ribosomal protein S18 acetylase RimI-like enzyme